MCVDEVADLVVDDDMPELPPSHMLECRANELCLLAGSLVNCIEWLDLIVQGNDRQADCCRMTLRDVYEGLWCTVSRLKTIPGYKDCGQFAILKESLLRVNRSHLLEL